MRVINVGVYPPPYGGVSIHLKRFLEYLQIKGKECLLIDLSPYPKKQTGVINYSWRQAIWFLLFVAPKSIIHFHNFTLKNTLIFFLAAFRHKTILSFHNERFLEEMSAITDFWQHIVTFFLNRLDYFVVDTEHSRELLARKIKDRTRILVIPEYIPPSFVPPLENEKIRMLRQKYKYLLASNAFQISFYKDQDLYGLDILVELVRRLVFIHRMDVGMVFLLPNIGDQSYFREINQRINLLGMEEQFIFVTEPIEESVSLWKVSDIVIRATNTDGNSLTVMEALSIQVPVVASDCCDRPNGTILFRNRDVDDLCDKVVMILTSPEQVRAQLNNVPLEDNAAALLKLYAAIGTKG